VLLVDYVFHVLFDWTKNFGADYHIESCLLPTRDAKDDGLIIKRDFTSRVSDKKEPVHLDLCKGGQKLMS
jgi:hypothetical protein